MYFAVSVFSDNDPGGGETISLGNDYAVDIS